MMAQAGFLKLYPMIWVSCCFPVSADALAFESRVDGQHVGNHRPLRRIKISSSQKDPNSVYRVHHFCVLTTLQSEMVLSKISPIIIVMQKCLLYSYKILLKRTERPKEYLVISFIHQKNDTKRAETNSGEGPMILHLHAEFLLYIFRNKFYSKKKPIG